MALTSFDGLTKPRLAINGEAILIVPNSVKELDLGYGEIKVEVKADGPITLPIAFDNIAARVSAFSFGVFTDKESFEMVRHFRLLSRSEWLSILLYDEGNPTINNGGPFSVEISSGKITNSPKFDFTFDQGPTTIEVKGNAVYG